MQFTQEELSALLALLNRVNINGQEAEVVAMLKQKIRQGLEPKQQAEPKPEPKK